MSALATNRRQHLAKADFGLPGSNKYPMPDRGHAANAKARASQQLHEGKLSVSAQRRIDN